MSEHGFKRNNQHVRVFVKGNFALFTDPLSRISGEKISYSIPTYSALQGLMRHIYSDPSIEWIIDECRVLNRIRYESRGVWNPYVRDPGDIYTYQYLRDCSYEIKAHYVFNNNYPQLKGDFKFGKHNQLLRQAIKAGGERDLCFGCRECQAYIVDGVAGTKGYYDEFGEIDFGVMFHSYVMPTYKDPHRYALLWSAKMIDGVIKYPKPDECELRRQLFKEKVFNPKPMLTNDEWEIRNEPKFIPVHVN